MAAPPTANKATKLVAGTLVAGRYKVIREIGRGGMAQVYEGKHADIGKSVAIKVLAAEFTTSPVVVERFLREARAAAAVRSPYICDVYDQGKLDDGRPFLVMELLEGESLYERMVRVRQFDPKTTVRIVTHVSRGLMKAHAANIVHRDLKPENIFLTTNEDGEMHAKILDFGLAKFYAPSNDGAAQARLTREGAIFGTPAYMSPEQVQGQGAVDHRADIWALGCIAYECLTGRTVWSTDKGIAMTFAQIASAPIPQITKYRPDLPRSVDEWFEKALSREIEARYQTAKDLAEGFAQALEQGPPSLMMTGELSAAETPLVPAALASAAKAEMALPAAGKPSGGTPSTPIELGSPLPPEPTPSPDAGVLPKGNESLTNETATSSTVKGPPPRKGGAARVLLPVAGVALVLGAAAVGAWQVHKSQGSQALLPPAPLPSASTPASSASAQPASSGSPQVDSSPTVGPKWLPLVAEGQARILAGELDEASKRFKEAQDTMGSAVARALNDHVSVALANKGPCRLSALGRVRPFSLSGGNTGRPTVVHAGSKLVVFWTDDHESLQHDHAYALQLDAQTLKPIGQPIDVTPEAERVGRLAATVVGEKIALAFTDTRGRGAGLYLRWLDATGRIAAPSAPLAPVRAAAAQPSLWTEGEAVWAAWEERGEADKTDVFVAKVSPGAALPPGVRLTDLRKGRLKPRAVGPQIATGQGSLEVVFRVDRDTTRPVTLLHVPESDPALAQGLGPAGPKDKDDRVIGQMKVLAAANAKGDVPTHKGDSPELACGKDGCFAVWHIERMGPVGGWFAALIDGKSGEVTWSKKFAGGGMRPSIGQNDDGTAGVAWFEGGRIRVAPINRDGVGAGSTLAHIAGDQPPASIVGAGGRDWAVAWLDFEGGKLEPYVLKATCQ